MPEMSLVGRRVLIAEDEVLIAIDMAEAFERNGAHVLGPASSIKRAFSLLDNLADLADLDFAVLDLNLGGELAYPLADALMERGVPFVFSTGYHGRAIPDKYKHLICLEKPATADEAVEKAKLLLGGMRHGEVALPFR